MANMQIEVLIPTKLTEQQIKILHYCEKYYDKIEFIAEHGGFDIVNGSCEIHYNNLNKISVLIKHLYDRPIVDKSEI
jgi:hypothetical protein